MMVRAANADIKCAVSNQREYSADNVRILREQLREIRSKGLAMSMADWDNVEEILEELLKQKTRIVKTDVLEEWCSMNPSDPECLIYD
jgi:hypothetical protein